MRIANAEPWINDELEQLGAVKDPKTGAIRVGVDQQARFIMPDLFMQNPAAGLAFLRGDVQDPREYRERRPPPPDDGTAARRRKLHERVEHDHTYHPPKGDQPERYAAIGAATKQLAHLLVDLCPEGRDLSLALTHLEDVRMRANAAIAKGPA